MLSILGLKGYFFFLLQGTELTVCMQVTYYNVVEILCSIATVL